MGSSGGKIEVAEVSGGDIGKGRIGVTRRKVENGRVEWSSDGSGIRVGVGKNSPDGMDEMVMLYAVSSSSVQSLLRLGRPNKISHT